METKQSLAHFSSGSFIPYFFISYSHEDEIIVKKLSQRLQERGFCVWVDYNELRGKTYFADEIRDGIRECSIFLECLSRSYVNKPYCEKEYICADEENRSVIAICLDTISGKEENARNRFPIGGNAIAFGKGLESNFDDYFEELMKHTLVLALRNYMEGSPESLAMPYIPMDQRLLTRLKSHNDQCYKKGGNYCLDQIHKELFPDISETRRERKYHANGKGNVSLYDFLSKNSEKVNVLLRAEGGMGKTVSMLLTCDQLLKDGCCAIYIPLHAINFLNGDSIEKYIERVICGNDKNLLSSLQTRARQARGNMFVFLDGINELPIGHAVDLVQKEIIDELFDSHAWEGTRFILSSRYRLPQAVRITGSILELEMLPLEQEEIKAFLESRAISVPGDEKVFTLLRNPLMLSLYADAENFRNLYQKRGREFGVRLEENPNTAGKIIHNFLQTQLLQATSVSRSDFVIYYVLLEYALPYLAWEMIRLDRPVSQKEVKGILKQAFDRDHIHRYQWLLDDKLEDILWDAELDADITFARKEVLNLYQYALERYRFVYRRGDGEQGQDYVEFMHQDLRDYFAAYYAASEVQALRIDPARLDEPALVLPKYQLSEELIRFCADILHEQNACPYADEEGWHFPGKTSLAPSTFSVTEQVMDLLRDKEDRQGQVFYQMINVNLLAIMRSGRKNCLARCDFSRLDLRLCRMNGCHFSEFYRDTIYTSTFDRAWMDRSFFLDHGHTDEVTALCEGREGEIISGDEGGLVMAWDYASDQVRTLARLGKAIVDMRYYAPADRLAIALEDQILGCEGGDVKKVARRQGGSQSFRYVSFDENGEPLYSYDLQPLNWYRADGSIYHLGPENLQIISGCVTSVKDDCLIVHSQLSGKAGEKRFADGKHGSERIVHYMDLFPDIKIHRKQPDGSYQSDTIVLNKEVFFQKKNPSRMVAQICLHEEDDRILVAADSYLLEYSLQDLSLLRKIKFKNYVHDVRYRKGGGVIAACGRDILVLNQRWTIEYTLKHEEKERVVACNPGWGKYYLVSADGAIKELDDTLHVRRIRSYRRGKRFGWVRDRRTDEVQMMFVWEPKNEDPYGERVSFETGKSVPWGWAFQKIDFAVSQERMDHILKYMVLSMETQEDGKEYTFVNHSGIWIYGCSFLEMRGNMAEADNQEFLSKNGGITDAAYGEC